MVNTDHRSLITVHAFLQVGVQPAGVEDAGGIHGALEIAVQLHQCRGERLEHARRLVPAAEQRRMAAGACRGFADSLRVGIGFEPAQRAAPFDELRSGQVERGRRGLDRAGPASATR
mgnify:CR=1 FL=1